MIRITVRVLYIYRVYTSLLTPRLTLRPLRPGDDANLLCIFDAKGSAYRRRVNKMRSSLRKRRIDLKAFWLRMRSRGAAQRRF